MSSSQHVQWGNFQQLPNNTEQATVTLKEAGNTKK